VFFNQVANDEINLIIKEFLKLISTFQQRLKERNPTKVKQKLRFVAGIKQVRFDQDQFHK
jgi:hypothetical protein